jgi:hypothetical protein
MSRASLLLKKEQRTYSFPELETKTGPYLLSVQTSRIQQMCWLLSQKLELNTDGQKNVMCVNFQVAAQFHPRGLHVLIKQFTKKIKNKKDTQMCKEALTSVTVM